NNVFPLLRQNYIDNKKIAYVSRSMITDQACMAATMISYCKGEQNAHMMTMKFFEHYDTLIKPLLISSGEAAMNQYLSNLQNIAALADISKDQFKVCLENTNLQDSLLKTQKSASEQLEIKTIPFILINGKKYEGAFTYEAISEEINKNL
ncbi:MAG: thioredoxin domain-containing protein, partial [Alphaproteobacteria bacterium]|nr:thioredoxin domain-containing protein [Alphaproteobacteria bacterium]